MNKQLPPMIIQLAILINTLISMVNFALPLSDQLSTMRVPLKNQCGVVGR